MVKTLLFLLLICSFLACETLDNTRSTQEAVQEVSEKYTCPFYFETSIEYDKAKIEITPECLLNDYYERGRLALDLFKTLKKNGSYFDIITLKLKKEQSIDYIIKGATLKKVLKKELDLLLHFEWLKTGDYKQFFNKLEPQLQKKITYQGCKKISRNLFQNPKATIKTSGFVLKNMQGKKHVRFQINLNEKHIFISYLLKQKNSKIMSFEINEMILE